MSPRILIMNYIMTDEYLSLLPLLFLVRIFIYTVMIILKTKIIRKRNKYTIHLPTWKGAVLFFYQSKSSILCLYLYYIFVFHICHIVAK